MLDCLVPRVPSLSFGDQVFGVMWGFGFPRSGNGICDTKLHDDMSPGLTVQGSGLGTRHGAWIIKVPVSFVPQKKTFKACLGFKPKP